MRWNLLWILVFIVACSGDSNENGKIILDNSNSLDFENHNQKISYCIGLDHANGSYTVYAAPETKNKFDITQIKTGMLDYLSGNELRIPFEAKDSIFDLYLLPGGEVDENAVAKIDASYAIGMEEAYMLISGLVGRGIDQTVDVDYLIMGVEDGFGNSNPAVPYIEARNEIAIYYADLNKELGVRFLKENALKENVITTESGLQYIIFNPGNGIRPNLTDTVVVHYTGRFIDGREFESTVPSNIPNQMTLLGLIPGWQEGLQLMQEGAEYRFFIPYDLAYGEDGYGAIEPFSALVYDIELIEVRRFQ